jgi:cytochrome b6-f complex iron-sulfur subunit
MPCDECVNRRAFLARAAEVAGAAALVTIAGCGDGQLSGSSAPRLPPGQVPGTLTVKVSDFPALATPGFLVKVGSFHAAKRTGTATFEAFNMACTHQGCRTDIVDGQTFSCDCHGSNFANDGSVINGPFTGETIQPLRRLTASYDPATDILTIS